MQRRVVCRREELEPGTMRAFKVGGPRIAVACLENSSYRAIHDTCPHEMASLARGKVEKMWVSDEVGHYRRSERCVVVCPWHNFEFDVDTGLSLCEPGRMRVKTYPVDLESDEVVVYV